MHVLFYLSNRAQLCSHTHVHKSQSPLHLACLLERAPARQSRLRGGTIVVFDGFHWFSINATFAEHEVDSPRMMTCLVGGPWVKPGSPLLQWFRMRSDGFLEADLVSRSRELEMCSQYLIGEFRASPSK